MLYDSYISKAYDKYFLGAPMPSGIKVPAEVFMAHRFEASMMVNVFGTINPEEQVFHEKIFRKFLAYAHNRVLDNDWRLGLYFLEWAVKTDLAAGLSARADFIIARAVSRWVNALFQNMHANYIVLPVWPDFQETIWVLGEKSRHPLHKPRVCLIKPFLPIACLQDGIIYHMSDRLRPDHINWEPLR